MAARKPDYGQIGPHFPYLSDTAVLIQAWKKSHAYVRQHNWYADSLELDVSTIQLRELLQEWSALLRRGTYRHFKPEPLRLVPAPKSALWDVTDGWKPSKGEDAVKLRPLAHLSIRDQALAMAFLICLADMIETAQGDPTTPIDARNRHKVVSYGHRLVSTWSENRAHFRWGNSKLYRQYYSDYQAFVQRPERIRQELFPKGDDWAIVQADLSQFYDLVKRSVLIAKLRNATEAALDSDGSVQRFFAAMERVFDWSWHPDDLDLATNRCRASEHDGLPQGLAASGFFANAYLLEFDGAVVQTLDKPVQSACQWQLVDYCRYVDDMRFVIRLNGTNPEAMTTELQDALQTLLNTHAAGLKLNTDKTKIKVGDSHSSRTPIADAMQAVEAEVSKPLDVETARQALEMLDGLLAISGQRREQLKPKGTGQDEALLRLLSIEPDVRTETLERFVAHRWRRTFRSLRIMADAEGMTDSSLNMGRALLDRRAESFAIELIRRWIDDPSNVRLLRVSMDLFPSPQHLGVVLKLLEAHLDHAADMNTRLVCAYVASEILRAGATETGFVRDNDEIPTDADVDEYRKVLVTFAEQRLSSSPETPWYLEQQALLFLAAMGRAVTSERPSSAPIRRYAGLHQLLGGEWPRDERGESLSLPETLPLILIWHRLSGNTDNCSSLLADVMVESEPASVQHLLLTIVSEDEELLEAVWRHLDEPEADFWRDHFEAVGYVAGDSAALWKPEEGDSSTHRLLTVICSPENPFRQETAALRLAQRLTSVWGSPQIRREVGEGVLTPARIEIKCKSWNRLSDPTANVSNDDFEVSIRTATDEYDERYDVPSWCRSSQRWKIEVGQIVRAAIVGTTDYSMSVGRLNPATDRQVGPAGVMMLDNR